MVWKYQAAAVMTLGMAALGAHGVTTNYSSTVDPTKLSIPNIEQTTSHDVAAQCKYYQPPFTLDPKAWPTSWEIATSNGMNTSAEFTALYNSIDWTKAPSIQPKTLSASGGLNLQGYDVQSDKDCWWSGK